MATDTTAAPVTQAAAPPPPTAAAGVPASAPAGTTGQGDKGQSLLSSPAKTAGDSTADAAAKTKEGTDSKASADAAAGTTPTGETPPDIQLKLPEGFVPDEAALGEFKQLAAESGLKPEGAQKVFDLYAKQVAAQEARAQAAVEARNSEWVAALKADKDIGGAAFASNIEFAKKGVVRFGSPGLLQVLNESGLGNHPELVRAFVKIGKTISEDDTRGAGSQGGDSSERAALRALYPSMFPKD